MSLFVAWYIPFQPCFTLCHCLNASSTQFLTHFIAFDLLALIADFYCLLSTIGFQYSVCISYIYMLLHDHPLRNVCLTISQSLYRWRYLFSFIPFVLTCTSLDLLVNLNIVSMGLSRFMSYWRRVWRYLKVLHKSHIHGSAHSFTWRVLHWFSSSIFYMLYFLWYEKCDHLL